MPTATATKAAANKAAATNKSMTTTAQARAPASSQSTSQSTGQAGQSQLIGDFLLARHAGSSKVGVLMVDRDGIFQPMREDWRQWQYAALTLAAALYKPLFQGVNVRLIAGMSGTSNSSGDGGSGSSPNRNARPAASRLAPKVSGTTVASSTGGGSSSSS